VPTWTRDNLDDYLRQVIAPRLGVSPTKHGWGYRTFLGALEEKFGPEDPDSRKLRRLLDGDPAGAIGAWMN
jgi:hypothetical protein